MDILWAVQREFGYIGDGAVANIAKALEVSPLEVRETMSFYHFFHDKPAGEHKIYLADTVIARLNGYEEVWAALESAVGCSLGSVSPDGKIGLFHTECIGLSDQEPAMLVDDIPFVRLTPEKVRRIVSGLQAGKSAFELSEAAGYKPWERDCIRALAKTEIREPGPVFFAEDFSAEEILHAVLARSPEEVISEVSASGLRGRGGAGFRTGLKWDLCRKAEGSEKYVICNADEGEPGTFKDRVLLMDAPEQVFLGMTAAAYAVGAGQGILYLRSEYTFLLGYLEDVLKKMRGKKLLGKGIGGNADFCFDIRIQMGAGAYVCGEESALIESCEGNRGTPRLKPPFPVEAGFLRRPTALNNVETFAAAARILEKGAEWFNSYGCEGSAGTRLLSISGDVTAPGIYEIPWGLSLNEVLAKAGAENPLAVQLSGPSGECVSVEKDGHRKISFDDINCNGSVMVFNSSRDILWIVEEFMRFFAEESCGICTPCRFGNLELLQKMKRIRSGEAVRQDIGEILSWSKIIRSSSRCGLGMTSPNPIITTMDAFSHLYEKRIGSQKGLLLNSFDKDEALKGYAEAQKTLLSGK